MEMIASNLQITSKGELRFAGADLTALAEKYGTPLYVMDEDRVRENCRAYTESFRSLFSKGQPLFAGKANSFSALYRVMAEENMGIDVVSPGEIYAAKHAGYPMELAFFHGNNKTDEDLAYAMDAGVGMIVVDSMDELQALSKVASQRGQKQKILLRITPGIDPHTYAAVSTGQIDSKFGLAIDTGAAEEAVKTALTLSGVTLLGFHCHVGSQVFGEDVFERAVVVMLTFIKEMKDACGFGASVLDLGGGFGVPYVITDGSMNVREKLTMVADVFHKTCASLQISEPAFYMEPGRSIVADAGLTLYTVGTVKTIPGYKTYVSVDGGMTDNPRHALYGSRYTILPISRMNEAFEMETSVVGRCCESGDIICDGIPLPKTMQRGDLLAVCTTGAYNYAMSSNYNRIPRPAMVMLAAGEDRLVIRRETYEDLISHDVM